MTSLPLLVLLVAPLGAQPQGELLDFTAPWCGPCQEMSPVVSALQRQGYPIRKVDFDSNRALVQQYGITGIPAFVLVVNGREVNRIVGRTSEGQLRRLLAQIPTTPLEQPKYVNNAPAASAADNKKAAALPKITKIPVVNVARGESGGLAGLGLNLLGSKSKQPTVIVDRSAAANEEPADDLAAAEMADAANTDDVIRAQNEANEANPATEAANAKRAANPDIAAATIRVRVKDKGVVSYGSGTIIESKPGRAVVLTCGHLLRDLSRQAQIEVDVYAANKSMPFAGKVIDADLAADVGLIAIEPRTALVACRIAADDKSIRMGAKAVSCGCSDGYRPSLQQTSITALNKYDPPDNIECQGVPSQGRSGGALFNSRGEIIGVCFAATENDQRGLYCGLKPIHALLKRASLAHLYRPGTEEESAQPQGRAIAEASHSRPTRNETAGSSPAELGDEFDALADAASQRSDGAHTDAGRLDDARNAEVICIIRPPAGTRGESKVVIINRASAKFVDYLKGEVRSQPRETMARMPIADAPTTEDQVEGLSLPSETDARARAALAANAEPAWLSSRLSARWDETLSLPRPYRRSAWSR